MKCNGIAFKFIVATCLAAAGLEARAGWFGFGTDDTPAPPATNTNVSRRYHMLVPDRAMEKELLTLFGQKRGIAETILVMRSLTAEKTQEIARFDKELLEKFGMKADLNYSFDPKAMTISEVTFKAPPANGEAAPAGEPQINKKLHRQVKDADEAKALAIAMTAKKLTLDELRVFAMVIKEKQLEIERVNNVLAQKFSMSRDRDYQYDANTMRLYEIVPLPRKSIAPAPETKPAVKPAASPAKPKTTTAPAKSP